VALDDCYPGSLAGVGGSKLCDFLRPEIGDRRFGALKPEIHGEVTSPGIDTKKKTSILGNMIFQLLQKSAMNSHIYIHLH
jgi:hypothetical protein